MTYDRRKYDGLTVEEKLDVALELLDTLACAFPDGPANHRSAHEAWMKAKQTEAEFWSELKLDIAKKGVFSIMIIVVGLLAIGLSVKLGALLK